MRNVILSGYFDSIGIYQAVSDRQQKLVQQWLDILGIDKRTADAPFHSLSWGQQRLALIVRALVKHPTLLILDEPLQGLDPANGLTHPGMKPRLFFQIKSAIIHKAAVL